MTSPNSTIILKGTYQPILCFEREAKDIESKIAQGQKDLWVTVSKTGFHLGDVKVVRVQKDDYLTDSKKDWEEKDAEYMTWRVSYLKTPPQERAKKLDLFNLMYRMVYHKDADFETKEKAIKIQETFFRHNPNRLFCNPSLYKALIGEKSTVAGTFRVPLLDIVTNALNEDIRLSRA